MRKTWLILYPETLEHQFLNIRKGISHYAKHHYVVFADKGDIATISYLENGEWRIFIDNFPGRKLNYATNFPISTKKEFVKEMKRIGLNLIIK